MKWASLLAVLALAGCGSSDEEDMFTLVPVTGTVTQEGKPLPNFKVSFMPGAGNKESTPAMEVTGPEGNFAVKFKGRTGIAAGSYKVTVTPLVDLASGSGSPEAFKDDPVMLEIERAARAPVRVKRGAKPKKATVKNEFDAVVDPKDGPVVLKFDLKGPVPDSGAASN